MGSLATFDLKDYISKHKIKVFVETGTYMGDGINYACSFDFERLYSIELIKNHYDSCVSRFSYTDKVELILNNSVDGLKDVVVKIKNKPALFWLDAHLPNFYDSKYGSMGDNSKYIKSKEVFIPLEEELNVIKNGKDISNDVFIIDDLRIYEIGGYEAGNWDGYISMDESKKGISFIEKLFYDTHTITKDFRNEGYLIIVPKK